jgi:hypothetical protein
MGGLYTVAMDTASGSPGQDRIDIDYEFQLS